MVQDESSFDQKWLDVGVYKCTGKLFDLRDGVAKCIPTDNCDDMLYVYYQECVKSCREYTSVTEDKTLCVGTW